MPSWPDVTTVTEKPGIALHWQPRDGIVVAGPDATTYLQGQASQDLAALAVGGRAETLILSPQGKIDGYADVVRLGEQSFVLVTDGGAGGSLLERLMRFRLRVKVTMEPVGILALQTYGPAGRELLDELARLMVADEKYQPVAETGVAPSRPLFVEVLGSGADPNGSALVVPEELGETLRSVVAAWESGRGGEPSAYWLDGNEATYFRVVSGRPEVGREITTATIPAEVGLVERTVSFTKGCFTGQELVARLDARGSKVARNLRGLLWSPGVGHVVEGAIVLTADGGEELGHLTSVAADPAGDRMVGLALLHRRFVPPGPVIIVPGDGRDGPSVAAEGRTLPLSGLSL